MKKDNFPLVVDLDLTLIKSDTLLDSVIELLSKNLFNIFRILAWLFYGKAFLKHKLSELFPIKPENLQYRIDILEFIKKERSSGREVYLCSGANENQVKLIYDYLQCFTGYFGSSKTKNLIGINKANYLVSKFGSKKFDYIGDSLKDLPIWENANFSYTVNLSNKTKNILLTKKISFKEIVRSYKFREKIIICFKSIRLYQWSKNLLVFLPIFLSQNFLIMDFLNAFIAFLCFSFVASFVYITNDIFDIQNDRKHPRKRNRPIASGAINIPSIFVTVFLGLLISFILSIYYLNFLFFMILVCYLVATFLYTVIIKKIFLLDVIILSCFYVIRIVGGGIANEISLSIWLISFSIFFFLFLALIKRLSELISLKNEDIKIYGRSYDLRAINRLQILSIISSSTSIFLLVLYFLSEKVLTLYYNVYFLLLICPLLFYWQMNIFSVTRKNEMLDDPILYIIRDKQSWFLFFIIIILITSQMRIW